ncbi:MAG: hypothetical protein ACRD12_22435 [Acidimicrobiales bacterium]
MSMTSTRIIRLAAASALALGLGAIGAGPSLAAASDPVVLAVEDGAGTDDIAVPTKVWDAQALAWDEAVRGRTTGIDT